MESPKEAIEEQMAEELLNQIINIIKWKVD
jgi:hypothetical protein